MAALLLIEALFDKDSCPQQGGAFLHYAGIVAPPFASFLAGYLDWMEEGAA